MMHLSPGGAARLEEISHSFPLNWLKWYSEIADTSKYVVGGHTAIPDIIFIYSRIVAKQSSNIIIYIIINSHKKVETISNNGKFFIYPLNSI